MTTDNDEGKLPTVMYILSFAYFCSALATVTCYPYLPFMVVSLGLADNVDDAGFYSGLIGSAGQLARVLSSCSWGRAIDIIGRKPCMVIGACACSVLNIVFGCSTNLLMVYSAKFLLGLLNPTTIAVNILAKELSTPKQEAASIGIVSGGWALGLLFGPAIGGLLSNPVVLYPRVFGHIQLFEKFPYLLPNLVISSFSIVSLITIITYLPETLNKASKSNDIALDRDDVAAINENRSSNKTLYLPLSEVDLRIRSVQTIRTTEETPLLFLPFPSPSPSIPSIPSPSLKSDNSLYGLLSISGVPDMIWHSLLLYSNWAALQTVIVLWAVSSHQVGGLEWSQQKLGLLMGIAGVGETFYTIYAFPSLWSYLGTRNSYKAGAIVMIPCVLGITLANHAWKQSALCLAIVAVIHTCIMACLSTSFSCTQLLVNGCVDTDRRGSLSGLMLSIQALVMGVGSFGGATAYAWSIAHSRPPPLDYHLCFAYTAVACIIDALLPLPPASPPPTYPEDVSYTSIVELSILEDLNEEIGKEGTEGTEIDDIRYISDDRRYMGEGREGGEGGEETLVSGQVPKEEKQYRTFEL